MRYKEGDAWVDRSFHEVLRDRPRRWPSAWSTLGVEKGDRVSILGNTRPEWTYFDFAALSIGATVVPIYQTNSPEECRYVLENSDAKVVVVEDDEQLEKVRKVRAELPKLEQVVLMIGDADDALSMEELGRQGRRRSTTRRLGAALDAVTPADICTFIYTSGTTGPPKGCIISHGNYRSMLDMVNETSVIEGEDVTYLYLPLAHSFALLIQLGSFDLGATIAYWERDPLKIVPNLAELKPTYFPSVPRIFEKIYTAANSGMEKEGGLKKAIFDWSIKVGEKMREVERAGRKPGFLLQRQYDFADKKVLSKIRGLFGGNLRLAVSGAAPINPDILRFFDAAGVLVVEGWGMTETSTAATIASADDFKFGTIGKPFPGCEVRIADDGEILVKGPNVFQGYHKNPEATARDDRRRLAPHRRHRRDRLRRLHQDHRPQKGHHHHRGRQEHHPGQPRGGDQAAPAGLPVRRRRRPPPLPGRPGHPRPRRSGRLRQGARPPRGPGRSWPPTPRSARPRSKPTSRRSTRNSPGSSRSRRSPSSPATCPRRDGELTPTLKVKRAVVAPEARGRDRGALRGVVRSGEGSGGPCSLALRRRGRTRLSPAWIARPPAQNVRGSPVPSASPATTRGSASGACRAPAARCEPSARRVLASVREGAGRASERFAQRAARQGVSRAAPTRRERVRRSYRPLPPSLGLGRLAGLAEQDRGGLLEHAAPGGGLLGLLLGGPLDHAADAALGDLEAVFGGDLGVVLVVLGEGGGDRFEAVAGDLAGGGA